MAWPTPTCFQSYLQSHSILWNLQDEICLDSMLMCSHGLVVWYAPSLHTRDVHPDHFHWQYVLYLKIQYLKNFKSIALHIMIDPSFDQCTYSIASVHLYIFVQIEELCTLINWLSSLDSLKIIINSIDNYSNQMVCWGFQKNFRLYFFFNSPHTSLVMWGLRRNTVKIFLISIAYR